MTKNLRGQCYLKLRDRVYRTYLAVEKKVMANPEDLISFDKDCEGLKALRSELCRLPIKPSTMFELYTKEQMRVKFKLRSPNLADCVMMSERLHISEWDDNYDADSLHVTTVNYW
jgi:phage terminase large subunit